VPVPLHRRRLRDRTFNQADEIARPLARRLDLPLLVDTVLRQRDTAPQAGLARRSRLQSLAGAFRALAPDLARCELAGLDIAIVDDVVTTGATANGLAAALRAAGAARVSAIAVARTVGPAQAPAQPARNR
jgi:predicted amidophosphoribosyltransferase